MKKVFFLCLSLFIVVSVFLVKKIKFDDEVWFGGDSWHYQSMAVNFAKGHGLMKLGSLGDYVSYYKFRKTIDDLYQPSYQRFLELGENGGYFDFNRPPGYVFFLGMIYKVFGVSPMIAKQIQLLLVIMVACFLPLVSFAYWKNSGFIAGMLGVGIYLKQYAKNLSEKTGVTYPNQIMTEPLMSVFLFLFVLMFIYWQKNKKPIRLLILGIVTGLTILIKGSAIFLPVLVVIYLTYQVMEKAVTWLSVAGFIIGVGLVILPWSIHASRLSGQKVIISTHGEEVILWGNNEYAKDGTWHKEGFISSNKNMAVSNLEVKSTPFYNQPEIESLSFSKKLLAFYSAYPEFIPKIFLAKINQGFGRFIFFVLALMLIGYRLLVNLINDGLKKLQIDLSFNISFLLVLLIFWLAIYYLKQHYWLYGLMDLMTRINLLFLGISLMIVIRKGLIKERVKIDIPVPFIILFLNFLMITLVTFGIHRFVQVIDFVFILVFAKQLLDCLEDIYLGIRIKRD